MMKFELTAELIGQLVFGMENQEASQVFDTENLGLVESQQAFSAASDGDFPDDRYLPLPEWKSVDGFNLMESFVINLRNPVVREELRAILKNLFLNEFRKHPSRWRSIEEKEVEVMLPVTLPNQIDTVLYKEVLGQ